MTENVTIFKTFLQSNSIVTLWPWNHSRSPEMARFDKASTTSY